MAKLWRRVWVETFSWVRDSPLSATATLMACQTAASLMGWVLRCMASLSVMPLPFHPRPTAGNSHSGLRWHFQKVRSRSNKRGVTGTSRALRVLVLGMEMTSRSPLMCLGLM